MSLLELGAKWECGLGKSINSGDPNDFSTDQSLQAVLISQEQSRLEVNHGEFAVCIYGAG